MPNVELAVALAALAVWFLHHSLEYFGILTSGDRKQIGISYLILFMTMVILIFFVLLI